jgi:predicted helicase
MTYIKRSWHYAGSMISWQADNEAWLHDGQEKELSNAIGKTGSSRRHSAKAKENVSDLMIYGTDNGSYTTYSIEKGQQHSW